MTIKRFLILLSFALNAACPQAVHAQTVVNASRVVLTPGAVTVRSGSGSPEGVITAPPASIFLRTDNGHQYLKGSGSGNTGWTDVAFIGTNGLISLASGQGISFAGPGAHPVVMTAGDDGDVDSAIVISNADDWIPIAFTSDMSLQSIGFNQYYDVYSDGTFATASEVSILVPGGEVAVTAHGSALVGQTGSFTGVSTEATAVAGSTLDTMYGMTATAFISGVVSVHASGLVGTIYGSGTAHLPYVTGVFAQVLAGTAGGDAIIYDTAVGMNVSEASVVGAGSSIGTNYGIRVEDQNVGANNYAIYTNAGDVVFSDITTINVAETPSRNNGLVVNAALSGSSAYTDAYASTVVLHQDGNGDIGTLQAAYTEADQRGDGDIDQQIGFGGYTRHIGSGTVTVAHGMESLVFGTGIYTTAIGMFAGANHGQITNNYGMYVESQTNGSAVNAAFYAESVSGGVSNYAIYTNAGNIRIGALMTTGAASGKKTVCVDTSTGILYASSTGTDCSN